ncbi:MnmC family methyltransferase [Prochlorococcus marinus]|uniref:MnmC-like methyltransferase domain-containing protein n=1 Tax=Prochlorococcus marinus (strain MIT 9211) TaxID=93059 RepID=A9BAV7_PROM4|nr:MnmC family methyltransferase [Prochlorococcus marinus]ABX08969.1 Hypothetical protein P9211_10381 [Prochlorococcus marinus str. MIT 9211]
MKALNSLKVNGYWKDNSSEGKVIWGDARQKLKEIPEEICFDIIMLDAFSPKKCPQLWSQEFLQMLTKKLANNGRIITYCSAASLRKSLKDAGLIVMSLLPINNPKDWSSGTIGIKRKEMAPEGEKLKIYTHLSDMEEEHLNTRAGIPYRDPSGYSTTQEMKRRRMKDQLSSTCKSTSSWKRKWKNAK